MAVFRHECEADHITDVEADAKKVLEVVMKGRSCEADLEIGKRIDKNVPRQKRADAKHEEDVITHIAFVLRCDCHLFFQGPFDLCDFKRLRLKKREIGSQNGLRRSCTGRAMFCNFGGVYYSIAIKTHREVCA